METISVRYDNEFIIDMERIMKENRYSTKAEFIREAVRDKMRDLEAEAALMRLEMIAGSSKRKTTKEQLRRARKKSFEELARKHGSL